MITDTLTLSAALLLGLAAGGHCVVMCGGIAGALGMATAAGRSGRPRMDLTVAYQAGRIASYTLAGSLAGGMLGGVIALLGIEAVRTALRVVSALALLVAAGVAFGRVRDTGFGVGGWLWSRLAPLGRRLLPVTTLPRALAFGMIWGWMPCGFVYSVLLIAALAADPMQAALTMLAFGLGTVPAMLATTLGGQQLLRRLAGRPHARRAAGAILLACAVLTFIAPWLPIGHGDAGGHGGGHSGQAGHEGHGPDAPTVPQASHSHAETR
ncbi:MAG: sulfite exporter TauE/SafE family protein [Lautropia sp.]